MLRRVLLGGLLPLALLLPLASPSAQTTEVRDRTALRVCADPGNLPYSNEAGEGFENKIAEVIADELQLPLEYTWFPQTVGFIRSTLQARRCDLIVGILGANEMVLNTNPYYQSGFVMFYRADSELDYADLSDPRLKQKKIGVVAGTPPAHLMARYGLFLNHRPYHLVVDTRREKPGLDMVRDVANGEIDLGLLWGPMAGYFIREVGVPMKVISLEDDPAGVWMNYRITMGVRHTELDWKRTINRAIRSRQEEINQILLGYGVPLLDQHGQPITAVQ